MDRRSNPLLRLFVAVSVLTASGAAAPGLLAQGYTKVSDVIYATVPTGPTTTRDLKLDLYLPNVATSPRPAVVWIHGGAWVTGSKANPTAEFLAGAGYVVASIEYRFSHEALWPAQIHDCKGAVRWLRKHAATYVIDADRIGAWGVSSGAHLAAMLGVLGDVGAVRIGGVAIDLEGTAGGNPGESSRVQAVVDWYGPSEFLPMDAVPSVREHDAIDSPETLLIGVTIGDAPVLISTAEPTTFLSRDDAPMMIVHGTADLQAPFITSARLFRRGGGGFGLDHRFAAVPDGGHGGPGFDTNQARLFLDEHLMSAPANVVSVVAVGGGLVEGGGATAGFRVTRTGSTAAPLTVRIDLAGDAVELVDYATVGDLVRLPSGTASVVTLLTPLNDADVEGDEVVRLSLSPSPEYRIDQDLASATVLLQDDESSVGKPEVTVGASDPAGKEGAADDARFTLTRTGPTTQSLTVRYRLRGTATPGDDYADPGVVTSIPVGAATFDVPIMVQDDAQYEFSESVILELLPTADYVRGAARSADARIRDDDLPTSGSLVNVLVDDPDVIEGPGDTGSFLLTRTLPIAQPLLVNLAVGGTATPGQDHAPLPTGVTFPAGAPFLRVFVTPIDDGLTEGDESVSLAVLPGAGYSPGLHLERTIVLRDDDVPLTPAPSVVLEVDALRLGAPFVASVVGPLPGRPWALLVSGHRGYFAAPGLAQPFLLGPQSLLTLGTGVLDAGGSATLGFLVPELTPLVGLEVFLQAAVQDAGGGLDLSVRAERTVLAP